MKTFLTSHTDKKQVTSSFHHLLLVVVLSIGTLSFAACSSSGGGGSNPLNAVLEFSPYDDGVYVYWNISDSPFASQNITSVNITAIGYYKDEERQRVTKVVTLDQLTQVRSNGFNGFNFVNLLGGHEYAFEFSIRIGDRPFVRIGITPAEANRADYREDRRIGVGVDRDGNQIADFVEEKLKDPDRDGVPDGEDIDDDGDGLIEITEARGVHSFASLENMRMDGSGLTNATMESEQGCGNGRDIKVCSGYELIADITFSSGFDTWRPIGDDANSTDGLCLGDGAFTATFEGNNFTITGLSITADNDCIGLFAQLDGAEVRNLNLHATRITGGKNVGVLAGWAQDTLIENVHTKSDLLRGVQAVGGLVGRIQLNDGKQAVADAKAAGATLPVTVEPTTIANIKDSSAKSEQILACASAGGLVGESDRIMIQNSYAIAKKIELPFNMAGESTLLSFACDSIRATFIASGGSLSPVTHHIYKGVGGLVGDGDSSLWEGNQWSSHPNLEEHIVVNIGDYTVEGNTKYPNDGSSASTYGSLNLTKIAEGGTRIVSSYAISGELTGNWKIGGLLGDGSHSIIESSFAVSKDIHAKIRTAGGLIAQADNTNISASYAIAKEINAAGSNTGAADGDKANGEAGGLIGRARVVNVKSSYAMAQSIHGGEANRGNGLGSAGGLIGSRINKDPDNKIDMLLQNSYAVFNNITGREIRPLIGRNSGSGDGLQPPANAEIIDSYWDTNATSYTVGTLFHTNRFFQNMDSGNPYAKLTISLQTGRDVPNAWTFNEPALDSTSDIFANWREVECAGGGRIWDLGSETDRKYPAINCTPDDLTEQRAWFHLVNNTNEGLRNQLIRVNTTLIDERINAELN